MTRQTVRDPEGFTEDGSCLLNRVDSIHAEGDCGECDSEHSRENCDEDMLVPDLSTCPHGFIAKPARRSFETTGWLHGGDGYYRLFKGTLMYAPEHVEGGFSEDEQCSVEWDNLDEPEVIENCNRMLALLREGKDEEGNVAHP